MSEKSSNIAPLKPPNDNDKPLSRSAAATGVEDADLQVRLISQLSVSAPGSQNKETSISAIKDGLSMLENISPDSGIEGMLSVQMVVTHQNAIEFLRKGLANLDGSQLQEFNLKYATKFMDLYLRQFAALGKHRGKGQQNVTVKHIHVNDGAQAIVGDVTSNVTGIDSRFPGNPPTNEFKNRPKSIQKADGDDRE